MSKVVSSPSVAVTSSWTKILAVNVDSYEDYSGHAIQNIGNAALTNFKIMRSVAPGLPEIDFLVDTDLNTATAEMRNCVPSNLYLLGAGANGQIVLNNEGVYSYSFWAKSSGTTVIMTSSLGSVE